MSAEYLFAGRAIAALQPQLERLKQSRQRWQRPLVLLALAAVVAGCALSLDHLDLQWSDVRLFPLLLMAAIVVPFSIAYSAINMMLMGHSAKAPIAFGLGVKVSVFAQIAEMLPIPGGALVRGAALVRAGSSTGRSAELVIAFALLWIACGAAGAGVALAGIGWPALTLGMSGTVSAFAIFGWLSVRYGLTVAAAALVSRLFGVALVAWRFILAFSVLGVSMPWVASMSFAFATILGSAASLVPAGLGVGEGLSALIAQPVGVTAAAAFLAAALSRFVGLAVNVLLALTFAFTSRMPETVHD